MPSLALLFVADVSLTGAGASWGIEARPPTADSRPLPRQQQRTEHQVGAVAWVAFDVV